MKRRIIHIDGDKCNGCGACAKACHEGAIGMVVGKARLLRDDCCDAFGDCLPSCPAGAISFTEREAAAYDREAVQRHRTEAAGSAAEQPASELSQWPVQIKLVPAEAPYFNGADLLVSATCAAYARGDFHERYIRGHITLVGCPKLDGADYSEKLGEIFRANAVKSVTVVRMEVPCCGGLENAVKTALRGCGKTIPLQVATISTSGSILG